MKRIIYCACTVLVFIIAVSGCKSKELSPTQLAKVTQLKAKVDSRNYTFVARSANPMSGRSINIDPIYSLTVSKDTVTAYLPYFGQAYTVPTNLSEGGIKFVSTKFDYETKNVKSGWEVKITIRDVQYSTTLYLNIGGTGYSSLSVQETNRQGISFYGQIEE